MFTKSKEEIIGLLISAKNILHKQETGREVTSFDIRKAHDYIEIALDNLVFSEVLISQRLMTT